MGMQVLMCKPDYFTVLETDIDNRYMDPSVRPDHALSLAQHKNLARCYRELGIDVLFIDPIIYLPDMTFTANSALISEENAILSNFKPRRRKQETGYYEKFYQSLGYEVFLPPKDIFFEGAGDALLYRDKILLGSGFRTDKRAKEWLEQVTEKEVVLLELVKPPIGNKIFYHADTALLVFEQKESFIVYEGAFTADSVERVRKLGMVYPVWYGDAESLALNGVVVERSEMSLSARKKLPKKYSGVVVLSSLANLRIQKIIETIGYKPILVSVTEFLKAGGGPFCMTKILY